MLKLRYPCVNPNFCPIGADQNETEHVEEIGAERDQVWETLTWCHKEGMPYAILETDNEDILGVLWPDGQINLMGQSV